jgi:hypothetical protein
MFSSTPIESITSKAPNLLSFVIIDWTSISGAEAPAVRPIFFLLINHLTSKSSALSIK